MRFYHGTHQHWCGIDLHAKSMYVCILDHHGQVLVHRNLRTSPADFLAVIEPYREGLVVAVECIFTWYWLADLCAAEGIAFVLGHALYMKAIHGGKAKNDRIDSLKIATLLRGGMLPQAYAYPAGMRATRDLLRRRLHLVRKRGQLLAHIQMTSHQYNLPPLGKRIAYPSHREVVANHFEDRSSTASCSRARAGSSHSASSRRRCSIAPGIASPRVTPSRGRDRLRERGYDPRTTPPSSTRASDRVPPSLLRSGLTRWQIPLAPSCPPSAALPPPSRRAPRLPSSQPRALRCAPVTGLASAARCASPLARCPPRPALRVP